MPKMSFYQVNFIKNAHARVRVTEMNDGFE